MTKSLPPLVLLAGLLALVGIAVGTLGSSALALAVVGLITACYLAGGLELHRYRQATRALSDAVSGLAGPVEDLSGWLHSIPTALRAAVRQRVEGERAPLPGPMLTPYLVGLLVLLGMLGTLLGMMSTLRGTGLALESASDLDAIRTTLAAPVKGLAFAFGTSIAGVAASAMLGLASALCRRERALAVQGLDAAIATRLRTHSRAHQRERAFELLQRQVDAMPSLVEQLKAAMAGIQQQSLASNEHQRAQQALFFERAEAAHARLAQSVESSLRTSVAEGARAASASLQPVAESTMAALARHAATLHDEVGRTMQGQLEALSLRLQESASQAAAHWAGAIEHQRASNEDTVHQTRAMLADFAATFEQRSVALVDTVAGRFDRASEAASAAWSEALTRQVAACEAAAGAQQQALATAAAGFETHALSLMDGMQRAHADLQSRLDEQAQAHARRTLDEIAVLVRDAAEAPRAAAAVIDELRRSVSESLARDTAMLEERGRLLATVETLLGAVNAASLEQRAAVDALVGTAAGALERVASRFGEQVDAQAARLDSGADRVAAGAIEVASLGDVLGAAVERLGESNAQLAQRLQAIEDALGQSLARSDEQLGYYVAQARDVVDLSLLAQKQILGELQQLAHGRAAAGLEPA